MGPFPICLKSQRDKLKERPTECYLQPTSFLIALQVKLDIFHFLHVLYSIALHSRAPPPP